MDIEQTFAASVFNARRAAIASTAAGHPQTPGDQVEAAIADLWMYGTAELRSGQDIQAIVDRYTNRR